MILIFTEDTDATVDFVEKKMDKRNIDYKRISLGSFFERYTISINPHGGFKIKSSSEEIEFENIDSVWLRTFEASKYQHMEKCKQEYVVEEWKSLWTWLLDLLPRDKVISPPKVALSAANKMLQLKLARELGLVTPKTLISSDIDEVKSFFEEQGSGVVKTLTSLSMTEDEAMLQTTYTSRVKPDDFERVESISEAPIICQEEINKDYEMRVTFVGNKLFPCKIESQKSSQTEVDWRRYDFDNVPHSFMELPADVKESLRTIINYFDIKFGSFDMAVTPEGDYVLFEMNPNSQWVWLERLADLPITDAFIDLLLDD